MRAVFRGQVARTENATLEDGVAEVPEEVHVDQRLRDAHAGALPSF